MIYNSTKRNIISAVCYKLGMFGLNLNNYAKSFLQNH